jgi:hypothetical protein
MAIKIASDSPACFVVVDSLLSTKIHTTSYTHKKNFVHNTTNNTSSTRHHDPPRLLASSGFKTIGECDRSTSHGDAQSPQKGDAIF